ncbi:unnamed protein product [Paramecium sonneborni]|uniref:Transmembrane protein n=1 Tax=Paramecium sonneborni TaxID=65129 RepID=A0A8S1L7P2_9CILI|nr:unnamed protein product [Paramecium sonneborni]
MIILLIFIIQIYGRILQQKGVPQKKGEKWNQSDQALEQIFDQISNNLTQIQKDDLQLIEEYIFQEGLLYYAQANQDEKQKIFLTLIEMIGELKKENEQETIRLEKNIQYFSQLNTTDKDIVMTKISQSLDKTIKDSSKEFNSKVVLQTIKKEIENFQSKPDRGGITTWNIREYKMIQEKNEQEMREIEYQIQEFLDQGFSEQKIREKITEFIDSFFGNSKTLEQNNKSIDEVIQDVKKQEEVSNENNQIKQYRQKVREIIREKLEQGKTEEEIQKEVDDYLKQNSVNDLSDEERNIIKLIIKKEIMRNQRQQSTINDDKSNNKVQENVYYICLGIFTIVLLIFIVIFIIRRDKIKNNQRKQIGFKIQDNSQDVEQMD